MTGLPAPSVPAAPAPTRPALRRASSPWILALSAVLLHVVAAGCRALPRLPPADLATPGWSTRHGQAIWTSAPQGEGVAGELVVATRADGACFVQFAKPPFTLATARAEPGGWTLDLAAGPARRGGAGSPPPHVVWFALAAAMSDPPGARGGWHFESRPQGGWRLAHPETGEVLEGFLSP